MPPRDAAVIERTFVADRRTTYSVVSKPAQRPAWMDSFFKNLTRFSAFLVFSILAAILVSLVIHSQLTLRKFGLQFLFDPEWDPVTEEFGALVAIYGTVVSSAIAMAIAIPVSFGIALFLTELSPPGSNVRSAPRSRCSRRFPALFTACGVCSCSRPCSPSTFNRR